MKRLAIFQCDWPLQVHTTQLAKMFSDSGYAVDLYLCNCDSKYVDLSDLVDGCDVNVINVSVSLPQKIFNKILGLSGTKLYSFYRALVPSSIIHKAKQHLSDNLYQYFIGVEKKGLLWAGALSEKMSVPLIYYSLELYLEDHPAIVGDIFFPRLRKAEKKYQAKAKATIIQDPLRAEELGRANNIEQMDWLYFPVSVSGPARHVRSGYFHEKFALASGKKILLYFGILGPSRSSEDLAKFSHDMSDEYVMILHGRGLDVDTDDLQNYIDDERFVLSPKMVSAGEIDALVASAHVGLALYPVGCANDELTAFASEKVALYCRAGIPFVAFDNRSYRRLFKEYECGALISSIDELGEAIAMIEKNYDRYSHNTLLAFDAFYNFQNNFKTLSKYIN